MEMMPPKYFRTYHWPKSEALGSDDKFTQFPHHFVGREIIITEKLDGGNTCLFNGEVYARSTDQPSRDGWMGMVRKYHAWKTLPYVDIVFYGEDIAAEHSIRYAVHEDETFYLFAVREEDRFLAWDDVEFYAQEINVPTVPVIFRGDFTDEASLTAFLQSEIKKPSILGSEREGFVIRHPEEFAAGKADQHVIKYVRKNHVQTDQHWRRNWQWNELLPISEKA